MTLPLAGARALVEGRLVTARPALALVLAKAVGLEKGHTQILAFTHEQKMGQFLFLL